MTSEKINFRYIWNAISFFDNEFHTVNYNRNTKREGKNTDESIPKGISAEFRAILIQL